MIIGTVPRDLILKINLVLTLESTFWTCVNFPMMMCPKAENPGSEYMLCMFLVCGEHCGGFFVAETKGHASHRRPL